MLTLAQGIGRPASADAILDRLLNGAHRLELGGVSLRRADPGPQRSSPAISETPADSR